MEEMSKGIVIFGATSGIARSVSERFAKEGENLILIGRDLAGLDALASDLEKIAGRKFPVIRWDVIDFPSHAENFRQLAKAHSIKGVFFAAGVLFQQDECDRDPEKTRLTLDSNLTGPAVILDMFAAHFRIQGSGFISCVSSVAGERGRGKVLAYAASKAGLTAYLAGLRHRLVGTGVFVQTIKPGFVRTRMTVGVKSALMAEPEKVAEEIVRAIRSKREEIYTPGIWKWIMWIVRSLPNPIFKRLKF